MQIEHDGMGQKFWGEAEGEEALLAYTMVNDVLNLHFLTAPNSEVADELCKAAFEYAKANGLKITSSNEYVDSYLEKHPEFSEIVEE